MSRISNVLREMLDEHAFVPMGEWVKQAACRDMNPEVFFPERGSQADLAKAVCARCPVSDHCLDHALRANERRGIWGGTGERDRRHMRRDLLAAERSFGGEVPTWIRDEIVRKHRVRAAA